MSAASGALTRRRAPRVAALLLLGLCSATMLPSGDLGEGRFALHFHLQPRSLHVREGDDRVRRGQVIGLVGNSRNSVAPHLHFHVMDGASPLDSNGLPYEIDSFEVVGHSPGTAAFDEAEEKGTPLAIAPVTPPERVTRVLPLDQSIVRFAQ